MKERMNALPEPQKESPLIKLGSRFNGLREHTSILAAFFVLSLVLTILSPAFLTKGNILDITRVVSINGIMAVGMTFVILTGGIDLSVGSTFALAGAITSAMVYGSYSDYPLAGLIKLPLPLALATGLLVAALIGYVNGLLITRFKVEPFIVTLGMMSFARGLTYLYSGGYPVNFKPMPPEFAWIGKGYVFFLPTPTVFFIIISVLGWFILRYTGFGRTVYAIGGNEETTRLSGINVRRNKSLAYVLLGVLAGFSGIIMSSRVAAASPTAGVGYELDVITGVVLGGTSLTGGRGSIFGTIIGVFIIGIITNGLNLLGVSTYYQYIIKGAVLILSIGLDGYLQKKRVK